MTNNDDGEKTPTIAQIRLEIKEQAERARNQVIVILGFVVTILTIAGALGLLEFARANLKNRFEAMTEPTLSSEIENVNNKTKAATNKLAQLE